jgi:cysteine synthase A
MDIANNPLELVFNDVYISLDNLLENNIVNVKLEGFSISGSIKIKSALRMVEKMELSGKIKKGDTLIESSSGNLGVALSIVCAVRGYNFICVTDPNLLPTSENLMKAYGTKIIKINEKDGNGGYLDSRIKYIKNRISRDKSIIWVNQYENIDNVDAHYIYTAPSIFKNFPKIDYLFIGAGTTGTLSGVSRYFKSKSPNTKIIAVDSVGSVTFGGKPGKRLIPGLGTSKVPPISKLSIYDDIVYVTEQDAIDLCRKLSLQGLLLGGSTGTILSGICNYKNKMKAGSCVVTISPDLGDKYLDTIYSEKWTNEYFRKINLSHIQDTVNSTAELVVDA